MHARFCKVTFNIGNFSFTQGVEQDFGTSGVLFATLTGTTNTYHVQSATATIDSNGILTVNGNGYFTFNNENFYGGYHLSESNSGGVMDFEATANGSNVAPTPEPSSLMLLGTGLLSAAGVSLRKRFTFGASK